ncbi:MAG TPA: methyltransferase domain-containing protein [Acidobacteriota bacterium]|nr:methyltransferase domain-containing protein [Acidobacteriota bacterium]
MRDPHQEFFDGLAAEWDLQFTAEDLERLSHIVGMLDLEEGMDVLDLGCGTGVLFDLVRRRIGADGTVTGVDFSIQMARVAHRNFSFANVNVVDADASALPFGDSTFDLSISFSAFAHFANQQRALLEARRVLKPGARFHIIHLISSKELSDLHRQIGGAVAHDALPEREEMDRMFNASSFTDVRIEDHPGLYLASAMVGQV